MYSQIWRGWYALAYQMLPVVHSGKLPMGKWAAQVITFSHFKGLQMVMTSFRSLIRPSLISPRTKLIGVLTIGLPAVITLKIPLNQQSARSYYPHSINNMLEQAT